MSPSTPQAPAARIPTPVLITLAMCGGIGPFSIDAYISGLPQIASEFGATASTTQLTLSGFLISLGAAQLVIGPWSDHVGRRTLLLVGTAGTAIAAALCALAPSIEVLIAARVLLGALGAAGIVLSRAIVADLGKGVGLAKSFSLLISIQSVAPVIAPIVGGLLVTPFGWRSVFWFLTALATCLFLASFAFVRESLPPQERAAGGPGVAVRQYLDLLRNTRYLPPVVMFVAAFLVMFAYISASSFVLQRMLGFSPAQYSIAFSVNSCMLVVAALVNARLLGRGVTPVSIVTVAGAVMTTAVLWLGACVLVLGLPTAGVLVGFFVIVTAQGFLFSNLSALAVGSAGPRTGTAAALLGASQMVVSAVVAPITGIGNGRTAVPMLLVMVAGTALLGAGLLVVRRVHRPQQA